MEMGKSNKFGGKWTEMKISILETYVSDPKILKNNAGSPLFHFFMATNSQIALRIANSVVNPKLGF